MGKNYKYAVAIALMLIFTTHLSLFAQKKTTINLPKYDHQRLIHFGFTLGVNFTNFTIKPAGNFHTLDSLYVLESRPGTGFNLGIVSNLHMGNHFDLRFLPALSFTQRQLDYTFYKYGTFQNQLTKTIESTFIDFPLNLKFKSDRINNYRIYVLGGIKYSIDLAGREQLKDGEPERDLITLRKHDFSYEYGLGIDFYLEYFKFSTEIKVSNGLKNVLINDGTIYTSAVDQMRSKVILLSLYFE